ncbi:spidroin-2-like [Penaeus monodon]|uniref:spidroin-2-like n=1 Tax=Penaeus monodon TaxID=6687 RepID=UPI0018A6F6FB|nr:spidroin-2-like [Penaeus monodon]
MCLNYTCNNPDIYLVKTPNSVKRSVFTVSTATCLPTVSPQPWYKKGANMSLSLVQGTPGAVFVLPRTKWKKARVLLGNGQGAGQGVPWQAARGSGRASIGGGCQGKLTGWGLGPGPGQGDGQSAMARGQGQECRVSVPGPGCLEKGVRARGARVKMCQGPDAMARAVRAGGPGSCAGARGAMAKQSGPECQGQMAGPGCPGPGVSGQGARGKLPGPGVPGKGAGPGVPGKGFRPGGPGARCLGKTRARCVREDCRGNGQGPGCHGKGAGAPCQGGPPPCAARVPWQRAARGPDIRGQECQGQM